MKLDQLPYTNGFVSSENVRGLLLIALTMYALHKGYTVKEVNDVASAVMAKAKEYIEMAVNIALIIATLIDNLHYTYRRTQIKMKSVDKAGSSNESM